MTHPIPPTILPDALVMLDYVGIAVFAVSGALLAAEKKQTLVTFIFFAVITGVGGGRRWRSSSGSTRRATDCPRC